MIESSPRNQKKKKKKKQKEVTKISKIVRDMENRLEGNNLYIALTLRRAEQRASN